MEASIKAAKPKRNAEESILSKDFSSLCVYLILKKYSDAEHSLTQKDILEHLENEYGLIMERKSIGRKLTELNEVMGIGVVQTKKGSYLSDNGNLTNQELHLIIDSLFCSRNIPSEDTKKIIKKLTDQASAYFKPNIKYTYSTDNLSKNENPEFFKNIEKVETAINNKKKISFLYNKWGVDGKLHKSDHSYVETPCRMVVHLGKYYLMSYNEDDNSFRNYRMDYITDMKVMEEHAKEIRNIEGYQNGIQNSQIGTSLPYMYTDEHKSIEMLVEPGYVHQVVDWLGTDIHIDPRPMQDGRYKATIKSSPMAMKYFALQFSAGIEITKPKDLRSEISDALRTAAKKYD